MPAGQEPKAFGLIARSEQPVELFDQVVVNSTTAPYESPPVAAAPYRRMALYLRILATGTGAHTLQVVPQFLEPKSGLWHDFRQGIYASMYFEDTVHATERRYVFDSECPGRTMRLQLLGASVTGSLYYTVSANAEFYS